MALFTASLNSGSNGNCYYVGNHEEAVLVDAGLSCRETERRMKKAGLDIGLVKAIFISHEHGDHVRGLTVLAERYDLPVYISEKTARYVSGLSTRMLRFISDAHRVSIGNLSVLSFSKYHDAAEPLSFMVSCNNIQVGVFTDIGYACDNLKHYFSQCHMAYLEANYDEEMLETGRYPLHLKNRIRGGEGHLSNRQALDLFINHRPEHMNRLVLSHLSEQNNHPSLVEALFAPHAADVSVSIASRYAASPVFPVDDGLPVNARVHKMPSPTQMSLFS